MKGRRRIIQGQELKDELPFHKAGALKRTSYSKGDGSGR